MYIYCSRDEGLRKGWKDKEAEYSIQYRGVSTNLEDQSHFFDKTFGTNKFTS